MSRAASGLVGVAIFVLLAALPLYGGAYGMSLALSFLIAFVLAQSWDWVSGEAGYVNLGHFVFYGLGAYGFSILLVAGLPLAASFALACLAVGAIAALLAFPLFRLTGDYFAFATLALVPLAEILAFNLVGLTGGADGLVLPPHYVLAPALLMAVCLAAVTVLLTGALTRSRFGYRLKSIRNDELAAEVVGVRVFPPKLKVLALSAAFAAFAGAIQAWQLSFIDPPTMFGLNFALVPVAMALLGGSGLRWGPLVGVALLFALQQWLLVHVTILQATIYGLVILLIGRFMPGGLLRASFIRELPLIRRIARRERAAAAAAGMATSAGLPLPKATPDRAKTILECRSLTMAFGGVLALDHVDLMIREGEIIGLVGANGSGKTTLFNCLSKVYEPKGSMIFQGRDLAGLRRDEIARTGIGRSFQIPRPFGDLTVAENIAIALGAHEAKKPMRRLFDEAVPFAGFMGLQERLGTRADALSLQEKKSLELARALALRPKLLLVDEVASGLTPAEVRRFVEHIREIRDVYGVTVIWVEHIFSALAQVVDRLVVLEEGRVIADAPLQEAVRDERVLRSYLGSEAASVT